MYLNLKHICLRTFITGCLLASGIAYTAQAQTLDQAREMIRKKNYTEAVEAFSKLMKQYGSRADVNKWYGEALYETGNYAEAEKYLSIAAKRRIVGAYPLLGAIYEREYRFADAISNYEKYKTLVKKDPVEIARADSMIAEAQNGEKALNSVEEVTFIDSLIVDKNRFFEYYRLGQESGRFIDYKMLANALSDDNGGVVFESQRGDRRIFGQNTPDNGYDLFETSKLYGNQWSEPKAFPGNINSAANENFPFVMTDGTTLYFASDNEESLGGYDLFVTKYHTGNSSYFKPEHLPMPFNSPFNDYLLAIDEGNQIGWFATDRYQPEDKVIIYLFIPKFGERSYYRDLTPEELRNRARITSIKDTWPENANYEKILNTIYNDEQDMSQQKGSFVFVVNDKILYYNLEDFESDKARKIYEQASDMRKLYQQESDSLDGLRKQWATGNASVRNSIKGKILQLETKTEQLQQQFQQLENEARTTEINYLRQRR